MHEPVMLMAVKAMRAARLPIEPGVAYWLVAVLCVAAALLVHGMVEKPLLRALRRRMVRRHEQVGPPGPAAVLDRSVSR